jgi:aryl-alcohol dehydrogenase-like predicted oxidoreductase
MTTETNLDATAAGTWSFGGTLPVNRMGFGAMQLAGPGVFGPPADRGNSIAVLRRAVELGVNHIDTSDFYGPYVVNELIREALHPYPADLVLVTKVGAFRDDKGGWMPASEPDQLRKGVEDNLAHLDVPALDLVNLRVGGVHGADAGSIGTRFEAMAAMREEGLIKHLGVSNVTAEQLAEAQSIAPVAQVQNNFSVFAKEDSPIVDTCTGQGIAYVPFFPLGSAFQEQQWHVLEGVAQRHGASGRQIALAWLLARSPAILLIPGTASISHLEQNIASAGIELTDEDRGELDAL